jgi:hypothetical protein
MASAEKIYQKAQNSAANVTFSEICKLAEAAGYQFRNQKGSHKTYKHPDHPYPRMMNFQNNKGMAQPYQVKQLLTAIDQYTLLEGNHV